MVRDDALVAANRPHTKHYAKEDRDRLGVAVARAREVAGHPFRPSFAEACGISVRSILKLETGDPVGAAVYEAVARALPGWTEDTPKAILDGGPIPSNDPQEAESGTRSIAKQKLTDEERAFVDGLIELDYDADEVLELLARLRARKQSRDVGA